MEFQGVIDVMNTSDTQDPQIVTDSDDFLARLIAPGAMFLVVLSIWTVIRMVWKEVDDRRIWILSASIVSLLLFFAVPQVMKARVIHRIIKGIVALLLFVPFVLGCYLTFYEGFRRLRFVENDFSFGLIFAAIIYIVGGFGVVKATYNISEFGRTINAGKIRFD